MSSTYSPNLQIELPSAGDQAGNWGSTTNTNLGTLIEQAISGYAPQAINGADVTLAMTPGASATARNMYLVLSGSGGANLIVPTNTKLYFIYNIASTAITVKTSAGTGISVPVNAKIVLLCDGTNVVVATNYMASAVLPNATLASPTMTGVPTAPTAAAGTSTTQVATTEFVASNILVGEIKMWGTGTAPSGYLLCNGQAVSRTTYAALFSVYGTTFGAGDGVTTFNIPNFAGRMPIGVNGTYTLAATGGSATTTLATGNLPSHTHTASLSGTAASSGSAHTHTYKTYGLGNNGLIGNASTNSDWGLPQTGYPAGTQEGAHSHGVTVSGTTDATGSGTAATTISPYLGIYYIIKT